MEQSIQLGKQSLAVFVQSLAAWGVCLWSASLLGYLVLVDEVADDAATYARHAYLIWT